MVLHKKEKSSDTKPIKIKHLAGQKFGYFKGKGFYLHNALPLSKRYADVAKEMFAFEGKEGVRFQGRKTYTAGQYQKAIASKSKARIYSKGASIELMKRITMGTKLTQETLDNMADAIWEYLNKPLLANNENVAL